MAAGRRSNGEGSIFFDESRERWIGVLTVGSRDGKLVRRKVSATTKAKAAERLRGLREKVGRGDPTTRRVPTVEDWLTYWLESICPKRCVPNTIQGYRSKVDQYLIPLLGHHRLEWLTPEHVEQAWDELLEVGNPIKTKRGTAQPLSSRTVLQAHRILSRALVVAVQRGHVARNVCTLIDAPSVGDAEVQPLNQDEARAVLDTGREFRNAARWSVALSLGLRQGETLGLRWDDVDLEDGVLRVRRALARITGEGLVFGKLKSKKSRRDVGVPPQLLAELREHRAAQNAERLAAGDQWVDHELVFCQPNGKPTDPRADWQAWRDLLTAAGVTHPYRLHDARHTAATLLLLKGVDKRVVMDILGHSQSSVTDKYQHVLDEMKRDAAEKMGAALWG